MKKTVEDVELKGRKVLLRADLNVPMSDGEITNDNRIVQALPTIKYVLEQGGRVILFSHLGKVKSEEDKKDKTLQPAAESLKAATMQSSENTGLPLGMSSSTTHLVRPTGAMLPT